MKTIMDALRKFNAEREWDQFHSPENLAKSIAIEAGELLECYQWNSDADLQAVEEELADVLSYALQMCERLHLDPQTIVLKKMEKNAAKYPVEKAKGKSTKYNHLK